MVITQQTAFLSLIIIFTVFIYKGVNCERRQLPEISLTRYNNTKSHGWVTVDEGTFWPDILIKDGDDYIVNDTKSVSSILLTCQAFYPVYWVMTDVKPVLLDKIKTHSEGKLDDDEEWEDIEVKEFRSYIQLPNAVSFTGLYTCRSVDDENLKKDAYVFLPGFRYEAQILLNAGDEFEVGLNGRDFVIIPCKVSKSDAEPQLSKKDGAGNFVPLSVKKNFDPKLGFTIEKVEVESIEGIYKCSIGKEEMIVNVVDETNEDSTFPIKDDTEGIVTWRQRPNGDGVECCSNTTISPDFLVVTCHNMPECDMKKIAFMQLLPTLSSRTLGVESTSSKSKSGECTYTLSYGLVEPFIMQCTGDGIDISGQYAAELKFPATDKVKYVAVESSTQNFTYNVNNTIRINVLKWINGTYWNQFEMLDFSKDELYAEEKFVVDCCGLHFHHAIGRIQRLVWKDGTVTKLMTLAPEKDFVNSTRISYVRDFCYSYQYDADDSEELLLTADLNMSHVECIVPRWYDGKPGLQKFHLNIKAPKEPVIEFSEAVVNMTYRQNQLGLLQLECKISEAAPSPKITWTKDGYHLNQTDLYWSMVSDNSAEQPSLNVLFMRATKEIEGEYECTAENWKGIAQKTFSVKVNPRGYLDYWIALMVFGGFFAVIFCCALRITNLEKRTAPKQIEPMSFVTEENY